MERIDQEISVGEDFFLPIIFEFEQCGQDYPIEISGYTVEMQVGYGLFIDGNTPIIDVTTEDGDIIIDGPNGKINIYVPNAITSTLTVGVYDYAVKVTNSVGLVERLIGGKFTIKGW